MSIVPTSVATSQRKGSNTTVSLNNVTLSSISSRIFRQRLSNPKPPVNITASLDHAINSTSLGNFTQKIEAAPNIDIMPSSNNLPIVPISENENTNNKKLSLLLSSSTVPECAEYRALKVASALDMVEFSLSSDLSTCFDMSCEATAMIAVYHPILALVKNEIPIPEFQPTPATMQLILNDLQKLNTFVEKLSNLITSIASKTRTKRAPPDLEDINAEFNILRVICRTRLVELYQSNSGEFDSFIQGFFYRRGVAFAQGSNYKKFMKTMDMKVITDQIQTAFDKGDWFTLGQSAFDAAALEYKIGNVSILQEELEYALTDNGKINPSDIDINRFKDYSASVLENSVRWVMTKPSDFVFYLTSYSHELSAYWQSEMFELTGGFCTGQAFFGIVSASQNKFESAVLNRAQASFLPLVSKTSRDNEIGLQFALQFLLSHQAFMFKGQPIVYFNKAYGSLVYIKDYDQIYLEIQNKIEAALKLDPGQLNTMDESALRAHPDRQLINIGKDLFDDYKATFYLKLEKYFYREGSLSFNYLSSSLMSTMPNYAQIKHDVYSRFLTSALGRRALMTETGEEVMCRIKEQDALSLESILKTAFTEYVQPFRENEQTSSNQVSKMLSLTEMAHTISFTIYSSDVKRNNKSQHTVAFVDAANYCFQRSYEIDSSVLLNSAKFLKELDNRLIPNIKRGIAVTTGRMLNIESPQFARPFNVDHAAMNRIASHVQPLPYSSLSLEDFSKSITTYPSLERQRIREQIELYRHLVEFAPLRLAITDEEQSQLLKKLASEDMTVSSNKIVGILDPMPLKLEECILSFKTYPNTRVVPLAIRLLTNLIDIEMDDFKKANRIEEDVDTVVIDTSDNRSLIDSLESELSSVVSNDLVISTTGDSVTPSEMKTGFDVESRPGFFQEITPFVYLKQLHSYTHRMQQLIFHKVQASERIKINLLLKSTTLTISPRLNNAELLKYRFFKYSSTERAYVMKFVPKRLEVEEEISATNVESEAIQNQIKAYAHFAFELQVMSLLNRWPDIDHNAARQVVSLCGPPVLQSTSLEFFRADVFYQGIKSLSSSLISEDMAFRALGNTVSDGSRKVALKNAIYFRGLVSNKHAFINNKNAANAIETFFFNQGQQQCIKMYAKERSGLFDISSHSTDGNTSNPDKEFKDIVTELRIHTSLPVSGLHITIQGSGQKFFVARTRSLVDQSTINRYWMITDQVDSTPKHFKTAALLLADIKKLSGDVGPAVNQKYSILNVGSNLRNNLLLTDTLMLFNNYYNKNDRQLLDLMSPPGRQSLTEFSTLGEFILQDTKNRLSQNLDINEARSLGEAVAASSSLPDSPLYAVKSINEPDTVTLYSPDDGVVSSQFSTGHQASDELRVDMAETGDVEQNVDVVQQLLPEYVERKILDLAKLQQTGDSRFGKKQASFSQHFTVETHSLDAFSDEMNLVDLIDNSQEMEQEILKQIASKQNQLPQTSEELGAIDFENSDFNAEEGRANILVEYSDGATANYRVSDRSILSTFKTGLNNYRKIKAKINKKIAPLNKKLKYAGRGANVFNIATFGSTFAADPQNSLSFHSMGASLNSVGDLADVSELGLSAASISKRLASRVWFSTFTKGVGKFGSAIALVTEPIAIANSINELMGGAKGQLRTAAILTLAGSILGLISIALPGPISAIAQAIAIVIHFFASELRRRKMREEQIRKITEQVCSALRKANLIDRELEKQLNSLLSHKKGNALYLYVNNKSSVVKLSLNEEVVVFDRPRVTTNSQKEKFYYSQSKCDNRGQVLCPKFDPSEVIQTQTWTPDATISKPFNITGVKVVHLSAIIRRGLNYLVKYETKNFDKTLLSVRANHECDNVNTWISPYMKNNKDLTQNATLVFKGKEHRPCVDSEPKCGDTQQIVIHPPYSGCTRYNNDDSYSCPFARREYEYPLYRLHVPQYERQNASESLPQIFDLRVKEKVAFTYTSPALVSEQSDEFISSVNQDAQLKLQEAQDMFSGMPCESDNDLAWIRSVQGYYKSERAREFYDLILGKKDTFLSSIVDRCKRDISGYIDLIAKDNAERLYYRSKCIYFFKAVESYEYQLIVAKMHYGNVMNSPRTTADKNKIVVHSLKRVLAFAIRVFEQGNISRENIARLFTENHLSRAQIVQRQLREQFSNTRSTRRILLNNTEGLFQLEKNSETYVIETINRSSSFPEFHSSIVKIDVDELGMIHKISNDNGRIELSTGGSKIYLLLEHEQTKVIIKNNNFEIMFFNKGHSAELLSAYFAEEDRREVIDYFIKKQAAYLQTNPDLLKMLRGIKHNSEQVLMYVAYYKLFNCKKCMHLVYNFKKDAAEFHRNPFYVYENNDSELCLPLRRVALYDVLEYNTAHDFMITPSYLFNKYMMCIKDNIGKIENNDVVNKLLSDFVTYLPVKQAERIVRYQASDSDVSSLVEVISPPGISPETVLFHNLNQKVFFWYDEKGHWIIISNNNGDVLGFFDMAMGARLNRVINLKANYKGLEFGVEFSEDRETNKLILNFSLKVEVPENTAEYNDSNVEVTLLLKELNCIYTNSENQQNFSISSFSRLFRDFSDSGSISPLEVINTILTEVATSAGMVSLDSFRFVKFNPVEQGVLLRLVIDQVYLTGTASKYYSVVLSPKLHGDENRKEMFLSFIGFDHNIASEWNITSLRKHGIHGSFSQYQFLSLLINNSGESSAIYYSPSDAKIFSRYIKNTENNIGSDSSYEEKITIFFSDKSVIHCKPDKLHGFSVVLSDGMMYQLKNNNRILTGIDYSIFTQSSICIDAISERSKLQPEVTINKLYLLQLYLSKQTFIKSNQLIANFKSHFFVAYNPEIKSIVSIPVPENYQSESLEIVLSKKGFDANYSIETITTIFYNNSDKLFLSYTTPQLKQNQENLISTSTVIQPVNYDTLKNVKSIGVNMWQVNRIAQELGIKIKIQLQQGAPGEESKVVLNSVHLDYSISNNEIESKLNVLSKELYQVGIIDQVRSVLFITHQKQKTPSRTYMVAIDREVDTAGEGILFSTTDIFSNSLVFYGAYDYGDFTCLSLNGVPNHYSELPPTLMTESSLLFDDKENQILNLERRSNTADGATELRSQVLISDVLTVNSKPIDSEKWAISFATKQKNALTSRSYDAFSKAGFGELWLLPTHTQAFFNVSQLCSNTTVVQPCPSLTILPSQKSHEGEVDVKLFLNNQDVLQRASVIPLNQSDSGNQQLKFTTNLNFTLPFKDDETWFHFYDANNQLIQLSDEEQILQKPKEQIFAHYYLTCNQMKNDWGSLVRTIRAYDPIDISDGLPTKLQHLTAIVEAMPKLGYHLAKRIHQIATSDSEFNPSHLELVKKATDTFVRMSQDELVNNTLSVVPILNHLVAHVMTGSEKENVDVLSEQFRTNNHPYLHNLVDVLEHIDLTIRQDYISGITDAILPVLVPEHSNQPPIHAINFYTLLEEAKTAEQVQDIWRRFMLTPENQRFVKLFFRLKQNIENAKKIKQALDGESENSYATAQADNFSIEFRQLCDLLPPISKRIKQVMDRFYDENSPIDKLKNRMWLMARGIYLLGDKSVASLERVFEYMYSKVLPKNLSIIDELDNNNEQNDEIESIGSGEPDNDNEPDDEIESIGSGESDNDDEIASSGIVFNRRRKREAPDLDFISRLKQPLPSTANSVHNSHIAKMLSMIWLSAKNTPFFRESAQLFFKGLLRLEFNQYNHTALQTNSEKRSASDRSVEANNGLNSKNFNVTAATTVIQNHSTPPQQLQLKPIMGNNGRTEPLMDEARSGDDWKKKRNQLNENDKHAGVVLYKTAYSSLCNSNSTSTNSNRSKNVMASLWECEGNIKSGKTDCARQNVLGVGSCDDITKDVRAQRRLLAIQKSMAPLYEQLKGVMSQQQTPYPDEKNITMSFGSLTEFDDNCHPITTKLLERGRRAAFEQVAKDSKLSKEIADKVKINPTSRTENISASVFSKPDLIDRKLHALDGRLLQDMVSSVLLNPSSDRLQLAFAHAFSENPASLSSSEVTEFIARYDKQRPEVQAQTHPMMTAGTFAQNTIEIIKSFTLMFGRTRPESTNIDEAYYNPLMKKAHHLEAWQYKSNLYAESAYLTTSIYDSVLDIVNNLDGFDHFSAHFTQKDLISFAILKHCLRQQNEKYSNSEQRIEQINEQERTRIFELFLQKVVSDSSFNPNDVITDTTEEGGLRVLPRGTWEGRLEVLKGTGNRRISSVDESGHTFFKNTSSKSCDPRDSAYFLLFLQHMLSAVNEWYFESKQRLEGKEQAIIDEAAKLFAKHNGFAKERLVEEINHSQAQAFYHEQERLNRKKSANNLPDAAKQISGAKEILKLLGKLNEQDNTEKAYEEAKLLFMQLSKADKISFIEALANDNKHYGLNYNDEWLRALSHLSATQNEAEKELLNDNLWAALGFHYSVSCQYLDSYTFNVRVTEQIRRLWQEDPLNKTADVPYDLMGELLSFIKSKLPIDISIAERIFMEKSGALSSDDQDALAYKEYLRACFQLYTYNEKKIDSILKEYFVIYKQAAQKLEALDVGGSSVLTIGTLTTRVLRFNNETHQQYEKETHKRTMSATSKFYQFLDTAHKQCSLLPFTLAQSEEKILTMLADAYQKLSESGSEGQQGLENLTKFYQAYQLLKELYRNNIDSSVPTEKQGEQSSSRLNVKIFELLSSVVRESFVRHPDVMVLDDLIEKEVFQCFAETTVDYNDDSSSQNSGISTDEKRRLHNNPAVARIALEYLQHLQAYGDKNEHSNDWLPDEVILKCKAIEQQLPIFFDVLRFDKMFERNNSSRFHLYGDSDTASVSSNKTQPTEDKKAQHNISEQPQNPKFRTPWQTYRVSEGVIQAIQQTPFFESILDTLKEKGYAIDEEYKIEFWTENGSGISFYHLKKEVAQYIYQQILMRREALLDPDILEMSKKAIIQKVAVRLYLISAANKYFANYANKGMRTWIVHCFEELANALEEEDILPERTADGEEVRHLIKEKMAIPAFEKLWNDILVKANISQPCSDDLVDGIRSELRDEFSISPPTKQKIQELIESYSAKLKDRLESYQPKIQYHKYHLKKEMFTIPDGNCFYSSIGGVTGESTKQVRQNAQNHLSSLAYDKQPALRNFYQHQGYFTTEDERIRLLKQLECGFISDFCPDPDFHDYWGDSQLLPAMAYSYQRPFVLIAQSNGTVTGYEVYYPDLTIDTHYEGDENGGNDSQKTMKADMSLSNFLQRDGIALNKQDDLWPEPVIITYDDESKHYCSVIVSEKT